MKLNIVNDLFMSKLIFISFLSFRFDTIFHTVNSFGDYDKIYIGIFENYANIKFKYRNANFVSFFFVFLSLCFFFPNMLKFKSLFFFFNICKYMHHAKHICKSLT